MDDKTQALTELQIANLTKSLSELKNVMTSLQAFQARSEEFRNSEVDFKERIERRFEKIEAAHEKHANKFEQDKNRFYERLRKLEQDMELVKNFKHNSQLVSDRVWKFVAGILTALVTFLFFTK